MKPKYYLLFGPESIRLGRVENERQGLGSVFHPDGVWRSATGLAREVTGMGGDSDFDEVSEKEARERFPQAFKPAPSASPSSGSP